MLNEINLPPTRTYKTNGEWQPLQFYTDCLKNSNEFYILLGYFSSSAINVLAYGFASFIANGGKVKMVINDALQDSDVDTIAKAYDESAPLPIFNLNDFPGLVNLLNKRNVHFFECLAYLIREKRIEIVAIKPRRSTGISHFKKGYFFDGVNSIGFKGSCNFTANALLANLEDVTAVIPEDGEILRAQFEEVKNDFYRYFNQKEDVIYIDPSTVEKNILQNFKGKNIQELIDDEIFINSELEKRNQVKSTIKTLSESKVRLTLELTEPSLQNVELRDYQMEAYNAWAKNDYHGIFSMATGTGKTFTAINCIIQEYLKNPDRTYRALILVPSIFLVKQWEGEVNKFGFRNIILVSSANKNWKQELARITYNTSTKGKSFIVLATYDSFRNKYFQIRATLFPADTILIADEAHNIASPSVKSKLDSIAHLQKKLALSATPKRIYDPLGTYEMEQFFNDSEPFIFRFTMRSAIERGYLSSYLYYPHVVQLTIAEFKRYSILSEKIARAYAIARNNPIYQDDYTQLLIQRKRIVHTAKNKLETMKEILHKKFDNDHDLSYTLVFVPEGLPKDDSESDDWGKSDHIKDESGGNIRLISQYVQAIAQINSDIAVNKIVSGDSQREKKLEQFSKGQIHVLAAMKCLDEGVDIPRAETAVFCSSVGNPRQFIQRRGRILRNHRQKRIAIIHDLVVVPIVQGGNGDFELERTLVSNELRRVAYFASLATNYIESVNILQDILTHYNLSIYKLAQELEEQ